MYDPAHARSRTVQPMGGNLKPDLTLKMSLVQFTIYRKPTSTDTLIPSDSNHRWEHELSAIRYFANRLITFPMTDTYKTRECNTIQHILPNNKYHPNISDRTYFPQRETTHTRDTREGKEQNNANGPPSPTSGNRPHLSPNSSRTQTLKSHIGLRTPLDISSDQTEHFTESGIYQLTCPECNKKTYRTDMLSFRKR